MRRTNGSPVWVNGTRYKSRTVAAETIGCCLTTICRHITKQKSNHISLVLDGNGEFAHKRGRIPATKSWSADGEHRGRILDLVEKADLVLPGYRAQFEFSIKNQYGQIVCAAVKREIEVVLEGARLSHLITENDTEVA